MPSFLPRTSYSTELRAWRSCWAAVRLGRSLATAIIIPKTVETIARAPSGSRMPSSRSFLIRGRGSVPPFGGTGRAVTSASLMLGVRAGGRETGRAVRAAGAATRQQSSIGPNGLRRLLPHPKRSRRASEGGAGGEAGARAPAAREARDRSDGAGHPPRAHRRPAEAARVPGPRPQGPPDHRRLPRPRGRPVGALVDPPAALGRGDRRERPDLPGAGGPRASLRSRDPRGALQRRVARHEHGAALRPRPDR